MNQIDLTKSRQEYDDEIFQLQSRIKELEEINENHQGLNCN